MKLLVLSDERFTCSACGACCRKWLPELGPGERESVQALQWPANDPLASAKKILHHGGKSYLARRTDGACIFLNESNGLCRIHEQFGYEAKPLGCQVFPFQIKPSFENEATVLGRYDCPTVRKNQGAEHRDALPQIRRWTQKIDLSGSFDEATRCHLEREQIQAVCEFVGTMLQGFGRDDQRALFIAFLCDVLAQTSADEIDREALAGTFAGLKRLVEAVSEDAAVKRPGWFARMSFRTLLGLYLRRDEDVLTGLAGRFGRVIALVRVVLGGGNFHALGLEHPAGKLRLARLFKGTLQPDAPDAFAVFWRMIRIRLDSFQFMGQGNNGRNFIDGLRSLAMLYPLVRAAAKYNAAVRGGERIEAIDVDYGATVIEHSFGRLAVLNQGMTRSIDTLLMDSKMFPRLVRTV